MADKVLSVFVDESGDFGPYAGHSPYYLVAMVFHDQRVDISENISALDTHVGYLGYPRHAIHTEPLIRRESIYANDDLPLRRKLFGALFHFTRRLDVKYLCAQVRKDDPSTVVGLTDKISKELSGQLREKAEYFRQFDKIVVYYDNGQVELAKILVSIFNALYANVEFRRVQPVDYKLFQTADLICTVELLKLKCENAGLSASETAFFESARNLKRKYIKPLDGKKL